MVAFPCADTIRVTVLTTEVPSCFDNSLLTKYLPHLVVPISTGCALPTVAVSNVIAAANTMLRTVLLMSVPSVNSNVEVRGSRSAKRGGNQEALLHKPESGRDNPSPRRSYAMTGTATVAGRPSCVKRLSKATRTCNSVTWRSNVRAITRSPRRLKQCILVSTRLRRW